MANKDIDTILEKLRVSYDAQERQTLYQQFQKKLVDEEFAIFLYSQEYLYPVSTKVKGINQTQRIATPSDRFASIAEWYLKTARRFQ